MNGPVLNLWFGWLWILLGFVSGTALGMFFADKKWLGGYGSFKRRMYRLGHISFFGLGTVNLLFWGTMRLLPAVGHLAPMASVASMAFIIGGVTMPMCCLTVAHFPRTHMLFAVPVLALILAAVLTLILIQRNPHGAWRDPCSFLTCSRPMNQGGGDNGLVATFRVPGGKFAVQRPCNACCAAARGAARRSAPCSTTVVHGEHISGSGSNRVWFVPIG